MAGLLQKETPAFTLEFEFNSDSIFPDSILYFSLVPGSMENIIAMMLARCR